MELEYEFLLWPYEKSQSLSLYMHSRAVDTVSMEQVERSYKLHAFADAKVMLCKGILVLPSNCNNHNMQQTDSSNMQSGNMYTSVFAAARNIMMCCFFSFWMNSSLLVLAAGWSGLCCRNKLP